MSNIGSILVPNEGPPTTQIMCIGEAPGWDEEQGTEKHPKPGPFLGRSGELLTTTLRRYGVTRESVYLANLFNYRPAGNKFIHVVKSGRLEDSVKQLYAEIQKVQPKVIIALGAWSLYYTTGKQGRTLGTGIKQWRGSILPTFISDSIKVVPTYHPAYCLRNGQAYPPFDKDIQRAVGELQIEGLQYPQRQFVIDPSPDELQHWVGVLSKSEYLSVDIETRGPYLACVGFSSSPGFSLVIQWRDNDFHRRDAISRLLSCEAKKILQFGWFDVNYLNERYNLQVTNYVYDTYIGQQTLDPELPRTLAYMTSIHTREPYYKDEYKESVGDTKSWGAKVDMPRLMRYNAKDTATTYEIFLYQQSELNKDIRLQRIFQFQMNCLAVARHISNNGMLVDGTKRAELKEALMKEWSRRQAYLDFIADFHVNVNSTKNVQSLLYDKMGFKARYKKKVFKNDDDDPNEQSVTSDEHALLQLLSEAKKEYDTKVRSEAKQKWLYKLMAVKLILIIRGIRKKLSSYIEFELSPDGRARSMYVVGGTETGRLSAKKWIDDTGYNAMTTPRDYVEVEL